MSDTLFVRALGSVIDAKRRMIVKAIVASRENFKQLEGHVSLLCGGFVECANDFPSGMLGWFQGIALCDNDKLPNHVFIIRDKFQDFVCVMGEPELLVVGPHQIHLHVLNLDESTKKEIIRICRSDSPVRG